MAITLPYEFDTSGVVKLIMRGVLGLLLVVLLGILYSLLVSHSSVAAIQLLLIAAIATYFGSLFLRNLTGSLGTITADAVVVQPGQLIGIRLAGPAGRFPISQFQAVLVERIPNPIGIPLETQIKPHDRVCLVGKKGTPDILVARTDRDAGRTLGNDWPPRSSYRTRSRSFLIDSRGARVAGMAGRPPVRPSAVIFPA